MNEETLGASVNAIAEKCPGRVGVGVVDLNTGESWYLNGEQNFRMQSVVKLAVSVAVLQRIDQGKLALTDKVALGETDVNEIRHAAIADSIAPDAREATVASLMERSMLKSNNGAVDVLTRACGGPAEVTRLLKEKHIGGIQIDRYEAEAAVDPSQGPASKDCATPRALCDLLSKLQKGELLSAASTNYLIDLMTRCETGAKRIRAGFPDDWTVADKTGTGRYVDGTTIAANDVAIIRGPNHQVIALAIFASDVKAPLSECEHQIADIARAVYSATK